MKPISPTRSFEAEETAAPGEIAWANASTAARLPIVENKAMERRYRQPVIGDEISRRSIGAATTRRLDLAWRTETPVARRHRSLVFLPMPDKLEVASIPSA